MKDIETNVSRRKFIGGAATAAGVAAISFPAVVQGQAAKGETIRVGLIGCGGRGTGAASQIMNSPHNTKLVAVADAFMDKAQGTVNRLKKQYGKKGINELGHQGHLGKLIEAFG